MLLSTSVSELQIPKSVSVLTLKSTTMSPETLENSFSLAVIKLKNS